jgi:hypothetical protein
MRFLAVAAEWGRMPASGHEIGSPVAMAASPQLPDILGKSRRPTRARGVIRRAKLALTQFWCSLTSGRSANQPSLKQIDLGPPIHLPFDQLEFRDLPFGLAVGPR